ncbi:MAG: hypothetical protein QOD06_638 [Candidatus Binatota bacterium]|jgi:hypothetical protein|nr:hypothetical protein [Candidatus Binatota bacterium]
MRRGRGAPKGIKDYFYETRALAGRENTVKRFASEALGGTVDPVMLGYVEKGKRFPNEALVRRLAAIRREDPRELLAVLYRDRIVHAFARELRRAMHEPSAAEGVADADLAVQVSRAIAALPDDGSEIPSRRWRAEIARARRGGARRGDVTRVVKLLTERKLVQVSGGRVRRAGRHFVASSSEERHALAVEFAAIFAKGLLEKLTLGDRAPASHVRNHYLHVEPRRIRELTRRVELALREIVEEFAIEEGPETEFLNVLVTATTV